MRTNDSRRERSVTKCWAAQVSNEKMLSRGSEGIFHAGRVRTDVREALGRWKHGAQSTLCL